MLDLSSYAGQFVDDAPASISPDTAQSIAQFTREYGGSFERIGTSQKFLMLLSILDYLGSDDPKNYPMDFAISYQDVDGHLSAGIDEDSPENSISEWLQHFAQLAQEAESDRVLWGIAKTLFESLHRAGGR